MRYSEYFEQVGECVQDADAAAAEKLLREVEAYSLSSVVTHSVLCAKAWMRYMNDPDNAVRCLLEAECNHSDDVRSLLEIAETYIELALHETACKRCIKKALLAASNEEDQMRLQEFFDKYANYKNLIEEI